MTYSATVSIEVGSRLRESDPDVRSVSRLPYFAGIEPVPGGQNRYEVHFEVEAGSPVGASDVVDELAVEVENALASYEPKVLEPTIA